MTYTIKDIKALPSMDMEEEHELAIPLTVVGKTDKWDCLVRNSLRTQILSELKELKVKKEKQNE